MMISKNKKGKMTLDKLAQMTANGFSELRTELKGDINRVENSITGLRGEFNDFKSEVNQKIDDGVSKILIAADRYDKAVF